MKNNLYLIILCIILILLNSSCAKEWLDKKPELSTAVPATLQDCQALMDNNSVFSNLGGLKELASDSHYFTEANAQRYLIDYNSNAYIWTNSVPYDNVSEWNQAYQAIFYCNLVLETLNKISRSPANANEWSNIKGQALFQRAMCFYELAQTFAPAYVNLTAASDLGVPLRLESNINKESKRSNVAEIYALLERDLNEAKALLPITPLNKLRPSKPAVFGLMARMYLSMEKYDKALVNADSCIKLYPTLINYSTDVNPTASRPFVKFNSETIFYSPIQSYGALFSARFNIPQSLYDLYSDNDLRKSLFFIRNTTTGIITFKGFYTGANAQLNGIASDEQYLIRSECYARQGNKNSALKDLNDLLKTRWRNTTAYPVVTATDTNDALSKILMERKKELILRGLRWSDLRRLNRDQRFATILSRTLNGITYTLEPNSYKYTFPIPQDVLQMTGIPQNIGWTK